MRQARRWTWAVMLTATLGTIGAVLAQDRVGPPILKKDAGKTKKAGLRAGGGVPPKAVRKGGAAPLAAAGEPVWPFHFKLRIASADGGTDMAATYYPSKLKSN